MMTAEPKHAMMRFLLGEMPAQERAAFEDQYIKDTDLFQRLVELENDLIDLYAMEALSMPERERLEHSFLADPDRRKRLSFAQALVNHPDDETPTLSSELLKGGIWPRWFHLTGPALLSIAAILLLCMLIGISLLLVTNHQLRAGLQTAQRQQAEALKAAVGLQQQVDALTKELNVRNQSGEQTGQGTPSDQNLLSLTLKDDSLRSGGVIPRLEVPSGASSVAFHLVFPADRFSSYELFMETVDGTPVWHKDNAKSKSAGVGSKEIVVTLSSRILKGGDYVMRITTNSSHGTEDVAGYSFSVVRR
jgi:hypothetical protein